MRTEMLPFNITLLDLNKKGRLEAIRPVTSLDVYETVGGNLHQDGLFSIAIFGRIGTPERMKRFSYIELKTTILHPFIYRALVKLKALYQGILTGRSYATWNPKLKDFEASDALDGETGYHFFMSHFKEIDFRTNKSVIRDQRVELLNKYRDKALTDKIVVLPAGLRDVEIDETGRTIMGDINTIYTRLLGIARTIANTGTPINSPVLDLPRQMLQEGFNTLYETIEQMLIGKRGFIQNRWASRRILNGTRNVITTNNIRIDYLGSKHAPHATDTVLGLFQLIKAIFPVTIHTLREGYIHQAFSVGENQARLVNPKTLESELVQLSPDQYDRWATIEGIEKVINSYREPSLRNKPVVVNGHYLALIYRGAGTFKVFFDIKDLPPELSKDDVSPINLCELIYLSGYRIWNKYAGFVTRYPITGIGSTYPTTYFVRTTIESEVRRELGEDWKPLSDEYEASEFPKFKPLGYIDTQAIPTPRLQGLGADFDGDTCSAEAVYSDQGLMNVLNHLRSKAAWVDPRGTFKASIDTHTVGLVFANMTGDPKPRMAPMGLGKKTVSKESYTEEGTFQHDGHEYDMGEIFKLAEKAPVTHVKVDDLKWVMAHAKPQTQERVLAADLSAPLVIMKWRDKWLVVDGLHRLYKAVDEGVEELPAHVIQHLPPPLQHRSNAA
jgi:hypothetical protein